jgi:hypothetical protein
MKVLEQHKKLEAAPNLAFRDGEGTVRSNPLMEPDTDLDEYEFTRLDLKSLRVQSLPQECRLLDHPIVLVACIIVLHVEVRHILQTYFGRKNQL